MKTHRTLICWQVARQLTIRIHEVTSRHWSPPASAAFSQIRRASLSVRLNIVEGHSLASPGSFGRHLNVAYGSAVETAELVEFCEETGLLPASTARELHSLATRVQALVLRLRIRCLRQREVNRAARRVKPS